MKKTFTILLSLLSFWAFAQTTLPNGNFESWTAFPYQTPTGYESSNQEVYRSQLPFNCVRSTDAYHGTYAVKLTTVNNTRDTMFGYMINTDAQDDPFSWHGGAPISGTPTAVRCYYKSDIKTGDTAMIFVAFSKNGQNIGTYMQTITGQQTAYTLLTLNLQPALSQAPDSVMFGAVSSNAMKEELGIPGSMLTLDSISMVGIATQPAALNGDFELWTDEIAETLNKWYSDDSRELTSIKTNDAYKGNYAVVLSTRLEDEHGNYRIRGNRVSTGYYPRDCNPCDQMGGYPFTNQTDTISFWYKYTAKNGSQAQAWVNTRKAGTNIWGNNLYLSASNSWQYAEIPIMNSQTPDTLVFEAQALRWEDSLLVYAGATLIIDEVQLKSQPLHTGLLRVSAGNNWKVYPNPVREFLILELPAGYSLTHRVKLINTMGQTVLEQMTDGNTTRFDVRSLKPGIYLYAIEESGNLIHTGKIILE